MPGKSVIRVKYNGGASRVRNLDLETNTVLDVKAGFLEAEGIDWCQPKEVKSSLSPGIDESLYENAGKQLPLHCP